MAFFDNTDEMIIEKDHFSMNWKVVFDSYRLVWGGEKTSVLQHLQLHVQCGNYSSSRRISITLMALFITEVPGPKIAATPALYKKS